MTANELEAIEQALGFPLGAVEKQVPGVGRLSRAVRTARESRPTNWLVNAPLPEFYKRFMLAYPQSLLKAKPKGWAPITDWEFANNPDRIIEMNRYVREQEDGYFLEEGPWPDKFFVIGEEEGGAGNYYAIDRHSGDETVYWFYHGDGEIAPLFTKSLDEFRDWMIEYFAQFKKVSGAGPAK
jgi:hypothetical protein